MEIVYSSLLQFWLKFCTKFVSKLHQVCPKFALILVESCSKFGSKLLQIRHTFVTTIITEIDPNFCSNFVPIFVTTWNKLDTNNWHKVVTKRCTFSYESLNKFLSQSRNNWSVKIGTKLNQTCSALFAGYSSHGESLLIIAQLLVTVWLLTTNRIHSYILSSNLHTMLVREHASLKRITILPI